MRLELKSRLVTGESPRLKRTISLVSYSSIDEDDPVLWGREEVGDSVPALLILPPPPSYMGFKKKREKINATLNNYKVGASCVIDYLDMLRVLLKV